MNNNSIRKNFMNLTYKILIPVFVLAAGLFIFLSIENQQIENDYKALQQKSDVIVELEESVRGIFFRARGYYAFQLDVEREQLDQEIQRFGGAIAAAKELPLEPDERQLINDLDAFMTQYFNELLPNALEFVENDDYEGLQAYSASGVNVSVNEFLTFAGDFRDRNRMLTQQSIEETIQHNIMTFLLFGGLMLLLMIILFIMMRTILKSIVRPVEKLTEASLAIQQGREFELDPVLQGAQGEVGVLVKAFDNMKLSISHKEDELSAQNEELTAQQLALHEQQDQLRDQLRQIEATSQALDRTLMVVTVNSNRIITKANRIICEKLGYSSDELQGKTTRIFRTGSRPDSYFEQMWQQLNFGMIFNADVQLRKKDGGIVYANMAMVPYLDETGHAYEFIMIAQDISHSKLAEEELNRTLQITKETKEQLELYNELNQSLVATFNKYEFLDNTIAYLNRMYEFDRSMLYLADRSVYSAYNVTTERINEVLKEPFDFTNTIKGLTIRKKLSPSYDQTLNDVPEYTYELKTVVANNEGKTLAVFRAERAGNSFSEKECEELTGIFNRISIAFDRILAYEEIEYSRKLNQEILDNMTEGLQLVDRDGCMIQHNKPLCDMMGEPYENKKVDCDAWLNKITGMAEEPEMLQTFFKTAFSEEITGVKTIRYTTNEEHPKVIDIYATTIFRGTKRVGTIFVYRDITRDYEVDRMKSELVSTVSHELRTPLSSVLGFTELLLTKEVKPEKQKRYIQTIHKEARRLTNLINDFLDLQRMESGRQEYHMEQVQMNEIILKTIESIQIPSSHHVIFNDEAPSTIVNADQDRLTQVLTNLISNAIKFSPDGGDVIIRTKSSPSGLMVSIQDQGLGIPKDQLQGLFQKFKRIDNSERRKIGGTGLGLAICKEIINHHDGTIWAESSDGSGSTFSFVLPVDQQSEAAATVELTDDGQQARVLILEDDMSLALLLSDELKSNGYSVVHHLDPKRAIHDVRNGRITSVVVDLSLSGELDGWDVIKELREDPATSSIPIVISSALDRDYEKMREYKIEHYLLKPYPPEVLSDILRTEERED
ncbi:ATP-binding protein [Jeotgalibacillus sp. R-1-5s-1]|uniref:ATP-binding protein n=1 Tax=Jeotgalibacillus sp. R-1-5s-1 TaxID=2555897 RepID=UPI00106C813D|nr:ATP-binding protein [Jeotgalibacillus sp. R-1-5s-1]TFE01835.1 PAS domain S-box protein [Jeotgalibacillus sp. R-1-5s-1]